MKATTFRRAINKRLEEVFTNAAHEAPNTTAKILIERAAAVALRAGKRSRPEILRLTYEAYCGTPSAALIDIGVALELHHQSLLIHDDISDNDTVRYDGPNVIGFYAQEHSRQPHDIPGSMGLLAGNILCSLAYKMLGDHPALSDQQKVALMRLLTRINIGVNFGQQLDIYNVLPLSDTFSTQSLLLTHSLKTALYSIELPMQCALLLLPVDESEKQKVSHFAQQFGITYQLSDDYADYFPVRSVFKNRPKYRDFREGKITYPLYFALQHARPTDIRFLNQCAGDKTLSDKKALHIVALLEECGARQASATLIETYVKQTKSALDKLAMQTSSQHEFLSLIDAYSDTQATLRLELPSPERIRRPPFDGLLRCLSVVSEHTPEIKMYQ